jgi:sugar phosphate permease
MGAVLNSEPPPALLAFTVWGLGAALYFTGFFQRVAPAVMTGELMADFAISAAALGNLSAFYFYSYVAMQVPTGILADRWGPRRLLTAGAAVAAAGSLVFAAAPSLWLADLGRLLIGGSVAVAFVAMLKIASHWFAPQYFARISGLALFVGTMGAVAGGVPLRLLTVEFGWRPVMAAVSIVLLLLAVAIWTVVRDDPSERGYRSHFQHASQMAVRANILAGIGEVFSHRNILLLVLIPGGACGPILAFAGLWGVPYLVSVRGMSPTGAATVTSLMLVGLAVGGLLFGAWSDAVHRRKLPYAAGLGGLLLFWTMAIFVPDLPLPLLVALLLLGSLCSGCMVVTFAFCKETVPARLAGTATGVANMGAMLGPMVLQPLVGVILDRNWNGASIGGARVYDAAAYQAGFAALVLWCAVSFLLLFATRETHGVQKA